MSPKPISPVKPTGMELVFFYICTHCGHELPLVAPSQPTMINCEICRQHYPVVPVYEHTVQFVKLMLADGAAAIDPDFF